jgi:hypothetical protein
VTYEPPPDVRRRIEQDFGLGALPGICDLLQPAADAQLDDRIVRCVLELAHGDIDLLRHCVEQAVKDYRDVIYWAEYDSERRIHDFSRAFGKSALSP